ncbi:MULTISPECIES: hypothetical protein [Pelosinus]|nr:MULTISPECIES: hypothetical protein [Pelosinus]
MNGRLHIIISQRMAQIMIEVAVMDVVEILKALGDGTRLRILHLLYKETLCVGHL